MAVQATSSVEEGIVAAKNEEPKETVSGHATTAQKAVTQGNKTFQ